MPEDARPWAPEPVTGAVMRRLRPGSAEEVGDWVAQEYPFSLVSGGRELATLLCLPEHLDELAFGFLFTEGLIFSAAEVADLTLRLASGSGQAEVTLVPPARARLAEWEGSRLVFSGCGQAVRARELPRAPSTDGFRWRGEEIFALLEGLLRAPHHQVTGGTHAAALAAPGEILCLREDVGRHNALDKLAGWWLLRGQEREQAGDKVVLTTGRLSSEMVLKVAYLGVPILVSRAAPTSLGIRLAHLIGLTLVGFARAGRLNLYTYPERIRW